MTNLVALPSEPLGEDIVERLEEVLTRARAGEISSIAIAIVTRAGCVNQCWSNAPSLPALMGSVALLQHKLAEGMVE